MIETYVDEDGLMWAVLVPEGWDDVSTGIHIGPPESLEEVIKPRSLYKKVRQALVEAGFFEADDLMGKRVQLVKLLERFEITDRATLRMIIRMYQIAKYGD